MPPFKPLPAGSVLSCAGVDLTLLASRGELRPAFGVEREVEALRRALSRAEKASAALIGPAGVGKSAIVEQFAITLASAEFQLDLVKRIVRISLQELAGLQPPGQDNNQYWSYFKLMLDEAVANNIVLFFDEAQALHFWPVSAQTLKPYLARGDLRIIAATTPHEFERFLRSDPALERRFQVIPISEPDATRLNLILHGLAPTFAKRYGVSISSAVISECIRLSSMLPQNQPDAAIDLLELAAIDAASSNGDSRA